MVDSLSWGIDHDGAYIACKRKHDPGSNTTTELYRTADGHPADHRDGYHKVVTQFDGKGRPIEYSYFDRDGKPANHVGGYVREQRVWLTGADGKPKDTTDVVYFFMARYDATGNRIEEAYFGGDGHPVEHRNGYYKITMKYKAGKLETERAFWGAQGEPVAIHNGYHRQVLDYDTTGRCVGISFFNSKNQAMALRISVQAVVRGSLGEKAGLLRGDVLLSYDGQEITDPLRFLQTCRTQPPNGPTKELKVQRGDKTMTISLPPGELNVNLDYILRQPVKP
jgi:hypothetical protein